MCNDLKDTLYIPLYSHFHWSKQAHAGAALWMFIFIFISYWNLYWNKDTLEPFLPTKPNALWHWYLGTGSLGLIVFIFLFDVFCYCGPLRHISFSLIHWFLGHAAYLSGSKF